MKRRTPKLACTITVLMMALIPVPALAQAPVSAGPAEIAAAKELLSAMGGLDQAQASVAQLRDAIIQDTKIKQPDIASGFETYARAATEPENPRVKTYLSDIEKIAVEFYSKNFSAADMQAIATFQRSEAGKKFQSLAPQLGALMVPRLMQFQQELIQDIHSGAVSVEEADKRK